MGKSISYFEILILNGVLFSRRKKSIEVDIKHLLTTIELVSDKEEFKLKTRIICDVLTKGIKYVKTSAVYKIRKSYTEFVRRLNCSFLVRLQ